MRYAADVEASCTCAPTRVFRRRAFLWHDPPHPFAQLRLPLPDGGLLVSDYANHRLQLLSLVQLDCKRRRLWRWMGSRRALHL